MALDRSAGEDHQHRDQRIHTQAVTNGHRHVDEVVEEARHRRVGHGRRAGKIGGRHQHHQNTSENRADVRDPGQHGADQGEHDRDRKARQP